MTKIVCDYCGQEKPVKKYMLPWPEKEYLSVMCDKYEVGKYVKSVTIKPHEAELCDDCAWKILTKILDNNKDNSKK